MAHGEATAGEPQAPRLARLRRSARDDNFDFEQKMNKHPKDAERWKKIVRSLAEVSVTVMADLVADEFIFGEIARVSREAPVLILKHRERNVVPGGGANAVMNLASLGVNVLPVGVVGDDEPGTLLLEAFREKKISVQRHPSPEETSDHHQDAHSRRHVAYHAAAGRSCRSRA